MEVFEAEQDLLTDDGDVGFGQDARFELFTYLVRFEADTYTGKRRRRNVPNPDKTHPPDTPSRSIVYTHAES